MSESIRNICYESLLLCMPVQWIAGGTLFANAYIFGDVLIDAGVTPMAIQPYKDAISTVVLTHCHFDHTAHVKEIAHMCQANVAIHTLDAPGLLDDARNLAMHFGSRSPGIVPDIILKEGDLISGLYVLHTPGHTPGSICLFAEQEQVLISGDTVFTDGGFGRYDFVGGSRTELARSIDRLSLISVEGLYPGHGVPVESGGSGHIASARQLLKSGYG
jgi:glyoxylase-like metal-dependent hydrolase (beta-lactamase superfamily II)